MLVLFLLPIVNWKHVISHIFGHVKSISFCDCVKSKHRWKHFFGFTGHELTKWVNHPSATMNPSLADKKITASPKQAANFQGIELLDHLIISANKDFYSFADQGIIWMLKKKVLKQLYLLHKLHHFV